MKKLSVLALAAACVLTFTAFGFTACGDDESENSISSSISQSSSNTSSDSSSSSASSTDNSESNTTEESASEVSYEVGDTVSSFTLKKYFGEEDETYTLQDDLDDGKIVILYFWYLGCQPCQEELPEFGEVAAEYSDEVSLVVIHSSTVPTGSADQLETYVADEKYMGWNFWAYDNVSFTLDNSDEQSVYTAMQGTNAYPMTVILNSNGVITARYTSQIDKATLVSEIESILNS
ncbi:MAG: TlpA family protein disulfide reductase [Clostridia bacterium]|nr:TlpA family protein disulfide reductase [Clostridia bacterium]